MYETFRPSISFVFKVHLCTCLFSIMILREKCLYLELFWSAFSCIRTEYEEILRISPYSVRIRENTEENNSEYGHFLRSDSLFSFLCEVMIGSFSINIEISRLQQSLNKHLKNENPFFQIIPQSYRVIFNVLYILLSRHEFILEVRNEKKAKLKKKNL